MPSRAQVLHAGGPDAKKFMVSPSSKEVVSRVKRRQGLKSEWALATEKCLEQLRKSGVITKPGIVLFNVGKEGKALYACVKKSTSK